jgi:hypothetical protein
MLLQVGVPVDTIKADLAERRDRGVITSTLEAS